MMRLTISLLLPSNKQRIIHYISLFQSWELALSKHHLSGNFFEHMCNFTSLLTVVLSSRILSGEIPQLRKFKTAAGTKVMNNSLCSENSEFFSSLGHLYYLNMHNKIRGKLTLPILSPESNHHILGF